jgi:hypothetical protein
VQATPNLLPVLDEQWRPARVVLAATPDMVERSQWLEEVIKGRAHGVQVQQLPLPGAYEYGALADCFMDFLAAQPEGEVSALNVTGGTKLMAVAAQQVFSAEGLPVFYVNAETDEVVVVGEKAAGQPLRAPLKVHEMLRAHGFAVESKQRPTVSRDLRDMADRIICHAGSHGRALGQINRLAASEMARKQLKTRLGDADADSISMREILGEFEQAGQLQQRGRDLTFPNESARVFVNGGWLEFHAYRVIEDLRGVEPRISDVAMNLKVIHPDGKTRNEIDVAFLYRNTLHLIECKTANLGMDGLGGDDKATEALYKLESLRKVGGLRTRAMVLDYRGALSDHAPNRDRARSAGIEIVAGRQLGDLRGSIQRAWLK